MSVTGKMECLGCKVTSRLACMRFRVSDGSLGFSVGILQHHGARGESEDG